MMQISKEYAEALFSLACENGEEKKIMSELNAVKTAFESDDELLTLLRTPSIPLEERLSVIDSVFGGTVSKYVLSLLKLMCERKRVPQILQCVEEYGKLLDEKDSVITAKVISAVPLTESERAALREKLEKSSGNTVMLDCSVDESILGGVIVEMLGKVTDGSLRHRLKEIKEVMI
jgi:F-type H+-transporting ATPase subunit delta